jgi:hypothetical protein
MLSAAADESEENRKKIESIASTSILITTNAQDLIIKREIPNSRTHSKSMDNSETRRCSFLDWRRDQDG